MPRYGLNRMKIYQAMGWMYPGNIANARGEKACQEAAIKNLRKEISMMDVHDCFSITALVTMEDRHPYLAEGRGHRGCDERVL